MARRLAKREMEWHKSCEAVWNDVHNLLQQWASSPDGPAAPLVERDADRMELASILSKITGCTVGGSRWVDMSAASATGWEAGCFDFRTSSTVGVGLSALAGSLA